MFVIEDELHAEQVGEFQTWEGAVAELRRLEEIPWDQKLDQAPQLKKADDTGADQ